MWAAPPPKLGRREFAWLGGGCTCRLAAMVVAWPWWVTMVLVGVITFSNNSGNDSPRVVVTKRWGRRDLRRCCDSTNLTEVAQQMRAAAGKPVWWWWPPPSPFLFFFSLYVIFLLWFRKLIHHNVNGNWKNSWYSDRKKLVAVVYCVPGSILFATWNNWFQFSSLRLFFLIFLLIQLWGVAMVAGGEGWRRRVRDKRIGWLLKL